jgi:uncharacterized protein YyaL (SSP411 family)
VAADVNRLARETSPYLLQHAENPVDWYAWGDEAFAAARERDVPILLSIGYSACHWCHVMEHESFSDDAVAELMNRLYVCVKVDREERPDVDAIYMDAVVSLTGSGGWPMTVFLTPDGRPFWGGTYFPPEPRHGMPSFPQLLAAVDEAYRERRDEVDRQADQMTRAIGTLLRAGGSGPLSAVLVEDGIGRLSTQFDEIHGGFGGAPKFPPSALLPLLLAQEGGRGRAMAVATLDAMADGGIHDQLGGGFHRYTVDHKWLVPHFEKMLYDNALLARAYAIGHVVTGRERDARVARDVLDYLDREMALEGGGIASAQDADTAGHEGLTFVWTPAEVRAALGDDALAAEVCSWYGITEAGNFEGSNVLSVVGSGEPPARLEEARRTLLGVRAERPQPARDDKALGAWNGMALAAYADAGRLLGEPAYVERARELARFLLGPLSDDGRLLRTWRDGRAKIGAFSDDYGAVADGLLALHRATGELVWLDEARRLTLLAVDLFGDAGGAFQQTARDGERLVARRPDVDDNPAPSGNSLLAGALLQLARLHGEAAWEDRAVAALATVAEVADRAAQAFGHALGVIAAATATPREIAIVGDLADPRTAALRAVVDARFAPHEVVVIADPADPLFATVPLLAGRTTVDGAPAAYVCERFACRRPVTEPAELATLLAET